MDKKNSKYIVLGACCAAVFWPGSLVFGFPGVMSHHWQTVFNVGPAEVGRILFVILVATGIFMLLVGSLLERSKPEWLMGIGAVACSGSTILLPLAGSLTGVYVWAFIMSGSTAMVYLSGLTVIQNWFPDRRGLMSGIFNMFFGGSAAVLSPIYNLILAAFGYHWAATGAAVCTLVFGLISATLIRFPLADDIGISERSVIMPANIQMSMTVVESMKTRSFWLVWFTWAFAGAAGISAVTLSTAFGISRGLSPHEAVLLLTAFNVTNGTSRIISGYLSDYIGRKMTLSLSFGTAGVAYFLINQTGSLTIWLLLFATIGYAFGTMFSVSAPLVADCFGMDHFGAIIGSIFAAYGFVSGFIGPWLTGQLLVTTGGNFNAIFIYLGALMLSAAAMIQLAKTKNECILPVR